MDSGNSGSIQSSSGGEEECDSRAVSISAFMNHPSLPPQPPQLLPFHHHPTTTSSMFDPQSNYFNNPISNPPLPLQNPNPLLNLDMGWSKPLRSHPILGHAQPFFSPLGEAQSDGPFTSSSPAVLPFPPVTETTIPRAASSSATSHVIRNPKKRSRASRRAPTTVLTTDTTNFRAMVQEFTGIPAPPFTSSPFPRNRFDLFSTPSHMRANPLNISQPPYLLRPFAQKIQPPTFAVSSSTNNIIITSGSSESGLFQSFLQSPPKYPLPNSTMIGSDDPNLKMGGSDEFGLGQGQVNNIPPNWGGGEREEGHYTYSTNVTNGKGLENVSTRGEGMVESWICSSE